MTTHASALRRFTDQLGELLDQHPEEARILDLGQAWLAELVSKDDWLPERLARPHPDHYQQYLLHLDPQERFSVVSFVWGPGQSTPIHDHRVWGLIGMLRGSEASQRFAADGRGHLVEQGPARVLQPGEVEVLSPSQGDIHQVANTQNDMVSISIHVYGADIGAVRRSTFKRDGSRKDFVSGYSPAEPRSIGVAEVRQALLERRELALLDVREEDPYAQEHPLWAANLPLSSLELNAWRRLPRRDVPIAVYGQDGAHDLALPALHRLERLGYTQVHLLDGGLEAWRRAGGELFRDVNVPSKAFGEWVEAERHTPSLSAQEVRSLIEDKADIVILDARRFDEYQTMSIPTATSVPGAELVLHVHDLAPSPATRVIVNCAGRTRSIIGTQSLVNAGIPNPVAALRNGTIGWTLAGQALDHGSSRRFGPASAASRQAGAAAATTLARRAGVHAATLAGLPALSDPHRSVYCLDVRTPEEYEAGHLPGFASAPGGQLVQETDHVVAVRGARIVLADDDGVRAAMTGSWLAQMGWEVHVLEPSKAADLTERGSGAQQRPTLPDAATITPQALSQLLASPSASARPLVLDFTTSTLYVKRHIPDAHFVIRSQLPALLSTWPSDARFVLTCASSPLARWAALDLQALLGPLGRKRVRVLEGGTTAWIEQGLPLEAGETHLASPRIDRYRRPYEGTDAPREAMQGYLDWEFGLVAQLQRDGTHHFNVV